MKWSFFISHGATPFSGYSLSRAPRPRQKRCEIVDNRVQVPVRYHGLRILQSFFLRTAALVEQADDIHFAPPPPGKGRGQDHIIRQQNSALPACIYQIDLSIA